MYVELETERLFIRPITAKDSQFIFRLVNAEGWLKFIGDRNITDIYDAENYILRIIENKHFFYLVFEIKETKLPIGIVTFLYRDNQDYPDIGFALLPEFEKNGFAFEACKKYLDEIIRHKTTSKVIAITIPENHKSITLLNCLGLTFQNNFTTENEQLSLFVITI